MPKKDLLAALRGGEKLTLRQQIVLTVQLSIPAILAQISSIIMQYIDASMVGHLGKEASASIGLVASSTWLMEGLWYGIVVGFSIMVAQRIGAGEEQDARNIVKQALLVAAAYGLVLAVIGVALSGRLPYWLRGDAAICADASSYFLVFALSTPVLALNRLSASLLQASGNMRTPSILMMLMCPLDVVYNLLFIFPTRQWGSITIPGAGMGVAGAAIGTALAQLTVAIIMCISLLRSSMLGLRRGEKLHFVPAQLLRAVKLGTPVMLERVIMNGAQVVTTGIIAPLGTVSIAANSFAITAEALCYMPAYGIESAAITLIGQSVGAKRRDLVTRLGWVIVALAVAVMIVCAAGMYALAPWIIGILSPDAQVVELGARVLRLAVFAEPLYAASIVAAGVFQGAGSSLLSSVLNFVSVWGLRIPLILLMASRWALPGVWGAISIELCFRGLLFLFFQWRKHWLPKELRQAL